MGTVNWTEVMGWNSSQIDDLRFQGFSFLKEGQYEKALIFFNGLVCLDPVDPYDIQTLGAIQLQLGNHEEALRTLEKALSLEPAHEPTQLNKALTLLQLSNRAEAFKLLDALQKSRDPSVSGQASALSLAYR